MKQILAFIIAFASIALAAPMTAKAVNNTTYASFTSPEGIKFISYRSDWGENELKEIYNMLLQLPHGKELKYLVSVEAFSESSQNALGEYGYDHIYLMGQWKSPSDYVNLLSHEYGHHFSSWNIKFAEYAKLRSFYGMYPVFDHNKAGDWLKIPNRDESWYWDSNELEAIDYQYLFGFPKPSINSLQGYYYLPSHEMYREYWEEKTGLKKEGTIKLKVPALTGLEASDTKYTISFSPASETASDGILYRACISDQTELLQKKDSYQKYCTNATAKNQIDIPKEKVSAITSGKAFIQIFASYERKNQLIWSPMYWYDVTTNTPKPIANQFYVKEKMNVVPVYINDTEQYFNTPPQIVDGSTLVPMRELFEHFGLEVQWNDATRTVTGMGGAKKIALTIDQKSSTVNGKEVELSVPPKIIYDKTYVPLRFVAEALDSDVSWDSKSQSVWIKTKSRQPKPDNVSRGQIPSEPSLTKDLSGLTQKAGITYKMNPDNKSAAIVDNAGNTIFNYSLEDSTFTRIISRSFAKNQPMPDQFYPQLKNVLLLFFNENEAAEIEQLSRKVLDEKKATTINKSYSSHDVRILLNYIFDNVGYFDIRIS